jgi:hypothetical protein
MLRPPLNVITDVATGLDPKFGFRTPSTRLVI